MVYVVWIHNFYKSFFYNHVADAGKNHYRNELHLKIVRYPPKREVINT